MRKLSSYSTQNYKIQANVNIVNQASTLVLRTAKLCLTDAKTRNPEVFFPDPTPLKTCEHRPKRPLQKASLNA